MLSNVAWTLLGGMPVNRILMRKELSAAGSESRARIIQWGGLHAVRSCLGAGAVVAFLVALTSWG